MTDPHGTPGLSQRSGMISLDLPNGAVPMHPGGVDDHHVTLAYLGDDVDDKALMHAVVTTRRAAGEHGPIPLDVGGLGTFEPGEHSDGKTPAYVPVVKSAALAALRASVGHLDTSGRPDWTPHITLAYLDDPADAPAPVPDRRIPIRSVTVHRGEDSWTFPLKGSGAPGPAALKVFVNGIVRPMDALKVGPKGYIHGWVFVGVPGVGAEVYHPHHGRGKVTAHDGKGVTVAFDKGTTHRFTARPVAGAQHHFEPRSGNTAEHGHLADRVARDPKAIAGLKDDELKGVDKELTDRAAALGHPGRVTKTHQKVKDEIARRGDDKAEANRQHVASRMANAETIVGQREALARRTGKKKDIEHAIAGHEEIAHNARGADMTDIADRHTAAADKLREDYPDGGKKPRSGKQTLTALVEDAKAKEAHAADIQKDPEQRGEFVRRARVASTAWQAASDKANRPDEKELHSARAEATARYADRAEAEGRIESVIKDPTGVSGVSDDHLQEMNRTLNNRANGMAWGGDINPPAPAADRAVRDELARRHLPVEEPWARLSPSVRSDKYPGSVGTMTDEQLAEADTSHNRIMAQIGAGGRVVGEGHIAVRQEMAARQNAAREAAYAPAAREASAASDRADELDTGGAHPDLREEAHEDAMIAHRRAAGLAPTQTQRETHTRLAQGHGNAAAALTATRYAEEDRQDAERSADKAYQAAAGKATAASDKARQEPTALNHAKAADAHRDAALVSRTGDEIRTHLAAAATHDAKTKENTHIGPGNRDDDRALAELARKKAQRTGTLEDHAAAHDAYARIAGDEGQSGAERVRARSRASDHREAVENLTNAADFENDAKIHADEADRKADPDAHRSAAQAYRNAAEWLDGVPGAKKRIKSLTMLAGGHEDQAAGLDKKQAAYADAFTAANRASNLANRTHDVTDHAAAVEAHRRAATLSLTPHQSAYHLGEAGSQQAKATTSVPKVKAPVKTSPGASEDWIRVKNWDTPHTSGDRYLTTTSLSRAGDFHARVTENRSGGFDWRVNRQYTDKEGPDKTGSNWSRDVASGNESTLAAARSKATAALKDKRRAHIAAGGDVDGLDRQ